MFIGQLVPQAIPQAKAEPETLRLAFAGGGTGGHLAPGIALIEELAARVPTSDLVAFTTGRPVETAMLRDVPVRAVDVAAAPPEFSASGATRFGKRTLAGTWRAVREFRARRPHAVIALGGYTVLPVALAARLLRIPLILCEQNVVAGRAVRFLSRWAHACITQWPLPDWSLHPGCEQIVRGNPVRRRVLTGNRRAALKALGMRLDAKTMLVMGGSQGASAINNWLADHAQVLARYAGEAQVIALTGAADYEATRARLADVPNVRVLPFAADMGGLYAAADVVVGRAGATSIAECTALGKPMALIPYPHAKDGHQLQNALYCSRAEAALVFDQAHLDGDTWRVLFDSVLLDDWQRFALADASAQLGRPAAALNAAREIVSRLSGSVDVDTALPSRRLAPRQLRDLEALWHDEAQVALANTPAGHPAESVAALDRFAA